MDAEDTNVTTQERMRNEDELRAALADLERLAPPPDAVLRAIGNPAAARALATRRLSKGVAAVSAVAATVAIMLVVLQPTAAPRRAAASVSLRHAILTAFDSSAGMVLQAHETFITGDVVHARAESWSGPTLPQPGHTARYRFVYMTPAGAPMSEFGQTYAASRPSLEGDPLLRESLGVAGVTREITSVDYTARTWFESNVHQKAYESVADSPGLLRREIASRHWTVVGHVQLNGLPTVKLRWTPGLPTARTSIFLWVGAKTHLPVQRVIHLVPAGGTTAAITTRYQLLPPTARNLAKLRPVVPAGFTRVAAPKGVMPFTVAELS